MRIRLLLAALIGLTSAGAATAQPYPSRRSPSWCRSRPAARPITVARIIGERMGRSLGQTIIIENTTGAAGSIAVGRVARAAPDGYTPQHRPLEHARRQRRDLSAHLRSPEGPRSGRAAAEQSAAHRCQEGRSCRQPERADRVGYGEPGQDFRRHRRRGKRVAYRRGLLPELHKDKAHIRSLSRRRAGDARPRRRNDRHHVRPVFQFPAAGARRQDQGLRGDGAEAARLGAPTFRRSTRRPAGLLHLGLARALGAARHAEGRGRETRRRGSRRACRSVRAAAA